MRLRIHAPSDAPADSRPILEGINADLGVTPNLACVAAGSPALLAGFDGMRRAVGNAELDPVLREVAGLAVGVAVRNHYGIAFHSTMLASLGVDEADIAAIRAGRPPSDPTAAAVHAFAIEAATCRGAVTETTVAALTDAGLLTETILELLLEVGFATLIGLIDNLADHVELDGFLTARAVGRAEQN